MSFIILILIIILLYASLSKYGSIYKVLLMTAVVSGMTAAFFIYGIGIFRESDIFVILDTQMNITAFVHACIIWFTADIIVIYKIIKNYRKYIEINAS